MKLSNIITAVAEGALDLLVAVAVIVMISGHRWLDVTHWIVALVGLAGAIWLASRRRRRGRISE